MTVGQAIGSGEELWRGVFSSGHAKPAARGKIAPDIFLAGEDVLDISVDRLDNVPQSERTRIGDALAAKRGPNRNFYGWAVVSAARVRGSGMEAKATPSHENPRHADIVLPPDATDPFIREKYAQRLAAVARWVPRA